MLVFVVYFREENDARRGRGIEEDDAPGLREADGVAAADIGPDIDRIEEAHVDDFLNADGAVVAALEYNAAVHAIEGVKPQAIQRQSDVGWAGSPADSRAAAGALFTVGSLERLVAHLTVP